MTEHVVVIAASEGTTGLVLAPLRDREVSG